MTDQARSRLFYDGTCGLCHGIVRFTVARDRRAVFTFAPLGGDTFNATVTAAERATLGDSLVVRTSAGSLLTRADAVLYILEHLGGAWHAFGLIARIVPRRLRDGLYDVIARHRYGWFGREAAVCPVVPADLRSRFER
jgi:predicted DCC family thiol-disulfide oxidoreductase YuxK